LAQHIPHVLSVGDGATHAVQSDAFAQVSTPVPVEVVLEPVVVVVPLVVFEPLVVVEPLVVFEPLVVVIVPVVAPPLPPLPLLLPLEVLVVVSLPPHATAIIDRTIAPNAKDFMLMPPTTSGCSFVTATGMNGDRRPQSRAPRPRPASRKQGRRTPLNRRRSKHAASGCLRLATRLLHGDRTARNITTAAKPAILARYNGLSSAFAEGATARRT
jgi:hypothetical protein